MALPSGTIVVADRDAFDGNGALIAVDPANGRQTTLSKGGMFVNPGGVALAGASRAFVSDQNAFGKGALFAVDLTTGKQAKIAASTEFVLPLGIICNPQGQLLVAYDNGVARVDPATGEHQDVAFDIHFSQASGVALDGADNLIVTDFDASGMDSRLHRIAPGGADTIVAHAVPATESAYGCVVIEPGGGILVGNAPNFTPSAVLRFDPATGVPTVVSKGQMLRDPVGLALESSGAIVVGCRSGIVRIDPATGAQTMVSSGGSLVFPAGVAIVP